MSRVTIAFLGQCQTSGYPGVPPEATFPQVCRRTIEACRPGTQLDVVLESYFHPSELMPAVRRALRMRPRVVIIEVVGWLAIKGRGSVDLSRFPRGVRTAYDRFRHLRHVAGAALLKIPHGPRLVHHVHVTGTEIAQSVLRPLIPRYPRPTLAEYETCVDRAIAAIAEQLETHVVVQGPGSPNLDLDSKGLASDTVERYRAVREMAHRVATARNALYVDRWDTVDGRFFLPESPRPGSRGHTTWGHLLATELLTAGMV